MCILPFEAQIKHTTRTIERNHAIKAEVTFCVRGESGPPCGVPSSTGLTQAAFHHPGLEKRPDEFEHTFIGHPRCDARHQTVMIDPVEKCFEIKINYDVVARGNVSLRLGYRLM